VDLALVPATAPANEEDPISCSTLSISSSLSNAANWFAEAREAEPTEEAGAGTGAGEVTDDAEVEDDPPAVPPPPLPRLVRGFFPPDFPPLEPTRSHFSLALTSFNSTT